jgi:transaldolase
MTNPLQVLYEFGQSPWYDNIERRLLKNGELSRMISQGDIRGVTSNPSIFNAAITNSMDYDEALFLLATSGKTTVEIYEHLVAEDIRAAADLFAPLYAHSEKGDGYVSLEVDPQLARDTDRTMKEALRLWNLVDRPNLMIKIPATREGLPAIQAAIGAGINVNVTLIFSLQRYAQVMDAFIRGLEERLSKGLPVQSIASVASFFVSRLDTKVDRYLDEIARVHPGKAAKIPGLRGKLAVANARLAYQQFIQVFSTDRWQRVQQSGALVQRPLWASTSTKDPNYPDTLYVDSLIGNHTVNTMPPKTLAAFKEHGVVSNTIENDLDAAGKVFSDLEELGISIDKVTQELEEEGVQAFADAFSSLQQAIEARRLTAIVN